jgi:hypothetical protein
MKIIFTTKQSKRKHAKSSAAWEGMRKTTAVRAELLLVTNDVLLMNHVCRG